MDFIALIAFDYSIICARTPVVNSKTQLSAVFKILPNSNK